MITVVIPTCDRPGELAATLAALAEQTRYPQAVLIVDNGIEPAPLPPTPLPVTVLRAPVRCGAAQARNMGAACATTPWIAFLDDDDRWSPDYLERLERAIRAEPQVSVRLARMRLTDAQGRSRAEKRYDPAHPRQLLYKCPGLGGSNIAVTRDAWVRAGGYDPRLPASEDTAFGWALVRNGETLRSDTDRITEGRAHTATRLSDTRNWLRGKLRFWQLHAREMGMREHAATLAVIVLGLWRRLRGQGA